MPSTVAGCARPSGTRRRPRPRPGRVRRGPSPSRAGRPRRRPRDDGGEQHTRHERTREVAVVALANGATGEWVRRDRPARALDAVRFGRGASVTDLLDVGHLGLDELPGPSRVFALFTGEDGGIELVLVSDPSRPRPSRHAGAGIADQGSSLSAASRATTIGTCPVGASVQCGSNVVGR